jgi:hypothetical protein
VAESNAECGRFCGSKWVPLFHGTIMTRSGKSRATLIAAPHALASVRMHIQVCGPWYNRARATFGVASLLPESLLCPGRPRLFPIFFCWF